VRTAFEAAIKRFCDKEGIWVRYRENPKRLTSDDFWRQIIRWQRNHQNRISQILQNKIESAQKFTLNELCHASLANICRKELADAINAVEEIERVLT